MSAEYDAETGESKYPNETDEAREDRERREKAGVGQPAEGEQDEKAGKHERGDEAKGGRLNKEGGQA
jgi:hypothetical protein